MAKQAKKNPLEMIKAYLATMGDLESERRFLVQESQSIAFPGSLEAECAREVRGMLEAFDVAHPEILATVKAGRAAADATRLAGTDVLGV